MSSPPRSSTSSRPPNNLRRLTSAAPRERSAQLRRGRVGKRRRARRRAASRRGCLASSDPTTTSSTPCSTPSAPAVRQCASLWTSLFRSRCMAGGTSEAAPSRSLGSSQGRACASAPHPTSRPLPPRPPPTARRDGSGSARERRLRSGRRRRVCSTAWRRGSSPSEPRSYALCRSSEARRTPRALQRRPRGAA